MILHDFRVYGFIDTKWLKLFVPLPKQKGLSI